MLMMTCNTESDIDVIEVEESESGNAIREVVDGYFDCIHIPSLGVDMWINDEGKLLELPINAFGTALWVSQYGLTDVVVGDIAITGGCDSEGATLGITTEQAIAILNLARETMDTVLSDSSSESDSSIETNSHEETI